MVSGLDVTPRRPDGDDGGGYGSHPRGPPRESRAGPVRGDEPGPGANRRLPSGRGLDERRIEAHARELIEQYRIKASPGDRVRTLSGGNIQKVLLARVLAARSAGRGRCPADARPGCGRHRVRARRAARASAGRCAAILLVSEDLDELLALSDRLVVMYEGRVDGGAARGRRRPGAPGSADGRPRRGRLSRGPSGATSVRPRRSPGPWASACSRCSSRSCSPRRSS